MWRLMHAPDEFRIEALFRAVWPKAPAVVAVQSFVGPYPQESRAILDQPSDREIAETLFSSVAFELMALAFRGSSEKQEPKQSDASNCQTGHNTSIS